MNEGKGRAAAITFEQIMFTLISAAQDVFRMFMNIEVMAGKVENKVAAVDMDICAIVGLAGISRIGYVMIAADSVSAAHVTRAMTMSEDVDDAAARDAFGELANNIAGVLKSRYADVYGKISMGLPLVVSGRIQPVDGQDAKAKADPAKMRVQQGVIIPFVSQDGGIHFTVMLYL